MAVMTAKDFYGEVNGDTINGFYKYLDKGIGSYEDRVNQFNKMYYEDEACTKPKEIWEELYEKNRVKVNLTSADSVMSETNSCKLLEAFGTYLLTASDAEEILDYPEEQKIVVLQPIKMLKGEEKTRSYESVVNSPNADEILSVEANTTNYKNQIKQVINVKDYQDDEIGDILSCYKLLVDTINMEIDTAKLIRDSDDIGEDSKGRVSAMNRIRILTAIKSEITTFDMLQVKDQIKKTIYFKAITSSMPVEKEENLENFDYWDKELTRILAKVKSKVCRTEYGVKYATKFEEAYNTVSESLNEMDLEIFEMWKSDANLQDFADEYDVNHKSVHSRVRAILTMIQRQMIEDYELDYYYTELVKGNWKTCSKCGEVKIASEYYFNRKKDTRDGFQAHCKKCNAERQKNE